MSHYRSGSLVFGGGHVVLPLLQAEVVPHGWVTNNTFLAGYGAAQAVPGPLFTFAAFLGDAAFRKRGPQGCYQDGYKRPQSFNFLGLTHYVGRSRKGNFVVGRNTEGKRFRTKLKQLDERLRELRSLFA